MPAHENIRASATNSCQCIVCIPKVDGDEPHPEADRIREIVGRVCGYKNCCRQAYKKSALSKPRNKKEKKQKKKQKELRKIQDNSYVPSIYQYWPCASCAAIALKRYKRTKDELYAFETVITRPWPLDVDWSISDMETFDVFNDHAYDILSTEDYDFIIDYCYGEGYGTGSAPSSTTVTEKDDSYSFHWDTTPSGIRRKHYTELPKYCIPASEE